MEHDQKIESIGLILNPYKVTASLHYSFALTPSDKI